MKQKNTTLPDWLNIRNIFVFLGMLGIGSGAGYLGADKQENVTVVNHVDKESWRGVYDYIDNGQMESASKRREQNRRIDVCQDEIAEERELRRQDIKKIMTFLYRIETNLSEMQGKFDNLIKQLDVNTLITDEPRE